MPRLKHVIDPGGWGFQATAHLAKAAALNVGVELCTKGWRTAKASATWESGKPRTSQKHLEGNPSWAAAQVIELPAFNAP